MQHHRTPPSAWAPAELRLDLERRGHPQLVQSLAHDAGMRVHGADQRHLLRLQGSARNLSPDGPEPHHHHGHRAGVRHPGHLRPNLPPFRGFFLLRPPVQHGNANVSENSFSTQGVTITQSSSGSPSTIPSSASIPETTVPMMV